MDLIIASTEMIEPFQALVLDKRWVAYVMLTLSLPTKYNQIYYDEEIQTNYTKQTVVN